MKLHLSWLAVLALHLTFPSEAQQRMATVVGHSRSIGIATEPVNVPGYGTLANEFTTYDGSGGFPLHDDSPFGYSFSGEFRPRAGSSTVYEADFAGWSSLLGCYQWGSVVCTMPAADSDGNGLPDFCQLEKGVDVAISGTIRIDWSAVPVASSFGLAG